MRSEIYTAPQSCTACSSTALPSLSVDNSCVPSSLANGQRGCVCTNGHTGPLQFSLNGTAQTIIKLRLEMRIYEMPDDMNFILPDKIPPNPSNYCYGAFDPFPKGVAIDLKESYSVFHCNLLRL